jgi:deoxycytidylate deaminase
MIKVAAKRFSLLSKESWISAFANHTGSFSEVFPPPTQEFFLPSPLVGMEIRPHQIPEHLLLLKSFAQGLRPVSAILTGEDNRILAYSWSETNQNRTAHAELGLIHSFLNEGLSSKAKGAILWVSLRPCAMCSAQILGLMTILPDLKIRFLDEDQGPASKNSCLFAGSDLWRKAGSPHFDLAKIEY